MLLIRTFPRLRVLVLSYMIECYEFQICLCLLHPNCAYTHTSILTHIHTSQFPTLSIQFSNSSCILDRYRSQYICRPPAVPSRGELVGREAQSYLVANLNDAYCNLPTPLQVVEANYFELIR